MLLIKNLNHKINDKLTLHIEELELLEKGIMVLEGASGSGKSTLIKLLLGLVPCKSLSWFIDGVDIAKIPVSKRNLSVVFQDYALFPHMTAYKNILFAAESRGLSPEDSKEKVFELSRRLFIQNSLEKPVKVLSGGEKQRVALARSLVSRPRFLFLDEPFSALDEDLRSEARLLVKSIVEDHKIPTLLVTHDKRDREVLASQILFLKNGKITKT